MAEPRDKYRELPERSATLFWPPSIARMRMLLIVMLIGGWMAGIFSLARAAPRSQSVEEGKILFEAKCVACHTIGGGDTLGPDLEGVTELRDREWLLEWIREPDEMIEDGDPLALQLLKEFNNFPMPNLGITESEAEAIWAYLDNPEGTTEEVAVTLEVAPPSGDPDIGEAIFTGATPLHSGAPACISCHSAAGVGALGGGTLGPDLTNVYEKLGDAGLTAALKSLPFPTMQGVFGDKPLGEDEAEDLYAYFVSINELSPDPVTTNFVYYGTGGFVVLLLMSHLIWRKRLTGVRKPLVGGQK